MEVTYEVERRLEKIEQSLYRDKESFTARLVEMETKMEATLADIKSLESKVEKIAIGLAVLMTALRIGPDIIQSAVAMVRAAGG